MKILMISHSSELGGAERSMIDLLDAWQQHNPDLQYHFVVKGPAKEMAKELKARNWKYTPVVYSAWSRRIPLDRSEDIFRNALCDTKAVFAIDKIIESYKPDVVMTNTIVAPWGAFAAKLRGIPHVWFVREFGDLDHGHTMELGREATFEDISYFSNLVVANSKTVQAHIEQYMPQQELTTVYTPFDIERLDRKSAEEVKLPFKHEGSIKLVITGRIAPSKGQADAAEAVGQLVKDGANLELCIVGSKFLLGDDETLMAAIEEYGIADRVHLVGQQGNPLPFVKAADIGIMASRMEAFGRTTFEYLAMGKPVVGANGGATPEIIHNGKNGYLYDLNVHGDLTKKIKQYVDTPKLLQKHATAARNTAVEMMEGEYNAESLLVKIRDMVMTARPQALPHIARTWLGYPSLAQRYIEESKAVSLKRILYMKLRQRAKMIIVGVQNFMMKGDKK